MERIEVSVQVHREHGGFHGEQREHEVDLLFSLCVQPEIFEGENSLQTEQIFKRCVLSVCVYKHVL